MDRSDPNTCGSQYGSVCYDMAKRLSKDDWIKAGFKALTEAGPKALKAEPLARRLGTTKGSFYWHFDDVPAFQTAMMETWETRAYAEIVTLVEQQGTAVRKLRELAQIAAGRRRRGRAAVITTLKRPGHRAYKTGWAAMCGRLSISVVYPPWWYRIT